MMACWLVSACRIVLLNAVCEASTTKSSKTAIASKIMTCFRLVRFGARVGAGVLTESETIESEKVPYAAIIEAEKRVRARYSRPVSGSVCDRMRVL